MLIVWADNADACSKQYAGTGALKTDFTRLVMTSGILLQTSRLDLLTINNRWDSK